MKRILFSLFVVPFIMIPVIYAILIPLIDFMVPPKAPPSSFNLYGNNGMIAIWGGILVYHSFFFLIACWTPFSVIQNAGKNSPIIRSKLMRWIMLSGLQVVPIAGNHLNVDFFKYGNGNIKWGIFYIITGWLLSLIPVRWLYLYGNTQIETEERIEEKVKI